MQENSIWKQVGICNQYEEFWKKKRCRAPPPVSWLKGGIMSEDNGGFLPLPKIILRNYLKLSYPVHGNDIGGFHLYLLVFPFVYQFYSRIEALVSSSFEND